MSEHQHCPRGLITEPFELRAERVIETTYRGLHHAPRIKKERGYWTLCDARDFSTYDADLLTRLVISAHDECIRVQITGDGGPGRVRITLHPRASRDGSLYDRHPTMEQAIANCRTDGTPMSHYAKLEGGAMKRHWSNEKWSGERDATN